jgi:UDP-N-acetylglucosamine--N-acetylmuramyl-(pentapeptide) pyrophosphoryl-undecaprenol N-acetylglucosamine transferase
MKRVLFIASGGGHTGYVLAIFQALDKLGYINKFNIEVLIPCGDSWSRTLLSNYADKIFCTPKPRLPGESIFKLLINTPNTLYYSLRNIHRYDLVIASGSNHSLYPAITARLRGSKIMVIESHDRFITRGKTVRLLTMLGAKPILHWREQLRLYPRGLVVGPIVRLRRYEPRDDGYILAIGGFEGNKKLYDTLVKTGLKNIVLQTGMVNPEIYRSKMPDWIVFDFDPDIDRWIAGASIVIGHNSVTVLEAAVTYGKPVIVLWNPAWSAAATRDDVVLFTRKINGVFLEELTPKNLVEAIREAYNHKPPHYSNGALELARIIVNEVTGS